MNLCFVEKAIGESRVAAAGLRGTDVRRPLAAGVDSAVFFEPVRSRPCSASCPRFVEELMPVPFSQMASSAGRIAVAYDDPIVLLLVTVWASCPRVGRGQRRAESRHDGDAAGAAGDAVGRVGDAGRVTLAGAAFLAVIAWLGTSVGLATVHLNDPVEARVFLPAALNLFAMTRFPGRACRRWSRRPATIRSRTIGIVMGILRGVDDRQDHRARRARLGVG